MLTLKSRDPQGPEKGVTGNCRAPDLGDGNSNPFEEYQVLLTGEPKTQPQILYLVYNMIKLDQ